MTEAKKISIVGLGNQASAWALNLRDSGYQISILLRSNSPSTLKAQNLLLPILSLDEDPLDHCKFVALLIPDAQHLIFFEKYAHKFCAGTLFIFAHGMSVVQYQLQEKYQQFHFSLLAPKAIASELRFEYETQGKLSGVYSFEYLEKEKHKKYCLNLASDLGLNVGPYPSTFKEETHADLFSEQSLLCSLLPYGSLYSYNVLREAGIPKEVAFLECWHELKLIANTLVTVGPEKFFDLISPNALIGAEKGRKRLLDDHFKQNLQNLFDDIKAGSFEKEIDETDFKELKKDVAQFWHKEELSQTFNQLKGSLYE